ncbi:aldehyde dehydrogenase, partial [Staphylococcus capitis]
MNDIEQQFNISKHFFKTNKTKNLNFSNHQLKALSNSIKIHEQALLAAL